MFPAQCESAFMDRGGAKEFHDTGGAADLGADRPTLRDLIGNAGRPSGHAPHPAGDPDLSTARREKRAPEDRDESLGKPICRRIRRGAHMFRAGDAFNCLYSIRCGFVKTSLLDNEGREQVTGFFMSGDLLGMDGLGSDRYRNSAIALEDSEVYAIPYSAIEQAVRGVPSMQRNLHALMGGEIARSHAVMLLLGSLRAKERIAAFLIDHSERLLLRGYSGADFLLHMSRHDIGSYLGLKLETVSRILSALREAGLVDVRQRHILIVDIAGLQRLVKPSA